MGSQPSLTAGEIELVRTSFDQVWAISSRTAALFYERLFASGAIARPLFRIDAEEEKRRFLTALAVIVTSLDEAADLDSLAERLAYQHLEFGAEAENSAIVAQALLGSLEEGLGSRWTPAVADAWRKAYRALSERMITGAYG
jgi:nitric oxide dioxygenase